MKKILISSAVAVFSVLGVAGTVSAAPPRVANSNPQCQVNGPVAGQGDDDFAPCVGPNGVYPPRVPESVTINVLTPICDGDVPYVSYSVAPVGSTANRVEITVRDLRPGKPVVTVLNDQPLTGKFIYPGASVSPKDWPGWIDSPVGSNTNWAVDPTDAYLRDGLEVTFQMEEVFAVTGFGPTAVATVSYPASSPVCAGPVIVSPPPPTLSIDALAPSCIADTPYVDYKVTATGTDATTATLTFFDLDGNQVAKYENLPLQGRVVYPGASVNPPDWPGWKFENGLWVVDPTDARWRDGLTVRVDVNPTAFGVVTYPPATAACNSPTQVAGPLPATGSDIGGPLRMAGLAAVTGIGLVLVARKRRSARAAAAV